MKQFVLKLPASLAHKVFCADQVRNHEAQAAKLAAVSMYELMERAGAAAFKALKQYYPNAKRILVLCGQGNNAGDGFVVARLAKQAGLHVRLVLLGDVSRFSQDTTEASNRWVAEGGTTTRWPQSFADAEVIVDALLGTGTRGQLRSPYAEVIETLRNADIPVLSLDIPSGLIADTGASAGAAVCADQTITFVGIKRGLVTGQGKQQSGELIFDDLGIADTFQSLATPCAQLLDFNYLPVLPRRALNSHKGSAGRVLCLGGNRGMPGAIRLTSEAALRAGAGLVKTCCHPENRQLVSQGLPELMLAESDDLKELLGWASCIVLGPGLGQDTWASYLFNQVLDYVATQPKTLLLDADALNLLAASSRALPSHCILTPHPGEAARLLGCQRTDIEDNRYQTLGKLQQKYQATVLLKGAGTLIATQQQHVVLTNGNPGMASPGMGDLLSGVIISLVAQGLSNDEATVYGASLHSAAADQAAQQSGERGMMASDLLPFIRKLVNR